MAQGERLYADHCASCHGRQGEGVVGLYPVLAGNPRVARDPATNLIRIIQEGGFGPATEGHPRPFGMPPFGHVLQAQEVAAVATFVRRQWNGASLAEVTPLEVLKHR
jgi:mono/diheme cytochrome c family protein